MWCSNLVPSHQPASERDLDGPGQRGEMTSMDEELQGKIRVLIVDDIPETRENVRKLLYFEKDIEVVGAAANGSEGIEMARNLHPDIVLMDINMPDIDGITATESITQSVPDVQIVMMSVQGETDYLRRSMLAGAREFLVKPFSADELIASIRRVYQLKPKIAPPQPETVSTQPAGGQGRTAVVTAQQGQIVAVYSPKGGTGCSTIATNLALVLNNGDSMTALVDGDLQFGDASVLLNLQPTRTINDLMPHMDALDMDFLSDVMVTHPSGMKALLAPPRPDVADMVRADDMREILKNLRILFEHTVVDTACYLDDVALTILEMSDYIILVTTPEIPAVKSTRLILEALDALDYLGKTRLVVNMTDRKDGISDKDIANHIKHPVYATIPRDNGSVTAAANQGVPIIMTNQKSPVSRGIAKLAELMQSESTQGMGTREEREASVSQNAESKTLLGRIFG
jgi:pilus assembly protein CpaE